MMAKKLILASALLASMALVQAQPAMVASAVSGASAVPMAIVLSQGLAQGSKVQDASAMALSVPEALTVAGSELVVDMATSTTKGISYGLRRVSDGATVSIEVLGQMGGKTSLAVGSVVTVVAMTGGIVLSAAGQAIAFIPNKIGAALLHNRVVK